MDFPGRETQLVESSKKPLMADDQLDRLESTKKTTISSRAQRKSPFLQLQQPGPDQEKLIKVFSEGECRDAADASIFGKRLMGILSAKGHAYDHSCGAFADAPPLSHQEEDGPGACKEIKKEVSATLSKRAIEEVKEEILNGYPGLGESLYVFIDPPDDQKISKIYVGCSKVPVPIPIPLFSAIFKPAYLYQGTRVGLILGQNSGNTSLGLIGRSFDNKGVQVEVFGEHRKIIIPIDQSGIQNKHEEVKSGFLSVDNSLGDDRQLQINEPEGPQRQDQRPSTRSKQINRHGQDGIEMLSKLFWESSSNVSSHPPWTPYSEEVIRIEEQFAHEAESMDCDGTSNKNRSLESKVLGTEATEI
ncbi:hypothetical protein AYI68_g242 [Smittium mucronatum]|uniref:Uncharacterized protein n=1 Tax=Smittium mucronatum TaxID=133383 RepID=A0A1R0H8P2_9FUNG|nr:hypothetical protein AYI68_g242 [Smittium mucronatum]